MALMELAANWRGAELHVATVNHGLRREAAQEARMVEQAAKRLGLPHTTLEWKGWNGRGNLQDAARKARRALLSGWAQRDGLDAIALGHTRDDQAETFLLRLARGSGVDGLAAMEEQQKADGLVWMRPLLGIQRDSLRDWLRARDMHWIEDPSNDDPGFDRVKARQIRTALAPLGLTDARLAETASRMAEAREVLQQAARIARARLRTDQHGDIIFDAAGLDALPEETRNRLVAAALCEIATQPYRPRLKALRAALQAPRATLHGCLITRAQATIRITREASAVAGLRAALGEIWDNRWQIVPPADIGDTTDLSIAALGAQGLETCPDRSQWQLPRSSLLASPAIWRGAELVAAPLAGLNPQWQLSLRQSDTTAPSGPYCD